MTQSLDIDNYCVCKQRYMNEETKELLKEIKKYRDGMVARNLPFQWISDIITKWETKKDFLEEAEKEKKELNESYKESRKQQKERDEKEKRKKT